MTDAYRGITTFALPFFHCIRRGSGIPTVSSAVSFTVKKRSIKKLIETISGVLAGRQPRDIPFYFPRAFLRSITNRWSATGFLWPIRRKGRWFTTGLPLFRAVQVRPFRDGRFSSSPCFFFSRSATACYKNSVRRNCGRSRSVKTIRTCSTTCRSYTCRSVVLDESGDPVDTVFCDVNRSSNGRSIPKERIIGKKGRRNFSRCEFCILYRIAIAERRSITYYFKVDRHVLRGGAVLFACREL